MRRFIAVSIVLGLVVGSAAFAAVPEKLSYQGVLTTAGGSVVPNGNYNLTLSLYDTLSGGSALWTEGQLTNVTNGIFNVVLGSVVPIQLAFDKPLYLGVSVAGGPELSPRTQLSASPYSLNSPILAYVSSSNTTTILNTWTNYADDFVTITVPGPGYVVVRSSAWLQINHTSGTADRVFVAHDTTATGYGPNYGYVASYLIGANEPTMYQDVTLPVQTVFAIDAPGSYTFYLNGMMSIGQDVSDHFWYANTTAEWYPATNPIQSAAMSGHTMPAEKTR